MMNCVSLNFYTGKSQLVRAAVIFLFSDGGKYGDDYGDQSDYNKSPGDDSSYNQGMDETDPPAADEK